MYTYIYLLIILVVVVVVQEGQGIPVLSEPRHSTIQIGGISHLARMTDKAQLSQDGKLGGDLQYPCPNDNKLLTSLGVQSSTFSEVVQRSKSDDEVLTFLKATVGGFNDSKYFTCLGIFMDDSCMYRTWCRAIFYD